MPHASIGVYCFQTTVHNLTYGRLDSLLPHICLPDYKADRLKQSGANVS